MSSSGCKRAFGCGSTVSGYFSPRPVFRMSTDSSDLTQPRALRPDPAARLELVERLPDPDQSDAAAAGVEQHVGHLPAELFGDLEAHRLLALDPIGLLQGGGVEPAVLLDRASDDLAGVG